MAKVNLSMILKSLPLLSTDLRFFIDADTFIGENLPHKKAEKSMIMAIVIITNLSSLNLYGIGLTSLTANRL
jgi:hypothetical protein